MRVLWFVVYVLVISHASLGEVISTESFQFDSTAGDSTGIQPQISPTFNFRNASGSPAAFIFNDLRLIVADVGSTFSGAADPDLPTALSLLTNGVNDPFSLFLFQFANSGGAAATEYQFTAAGSFFNDPTGASGIDFANASLTGLSVRLDSLTLTPVVIQTQQGPVPGQRAQGQVTMIVEGLVPEPITIILFPLMMFVRRARSRES